MSDVSIPYFCKAINTFFKFWFLLVVAHTLFFHQVLSITKTFFTISWIIRSKMLYLFETSGSQSSLYCPFFLQQYSFRTYHNKIQSCHSSICSVKTSASVGQIPFIWLLGCLIRSLSRVCHVFVICFSSCDVLVVFGLFSDDGLNIC